MNNKIKEKTDTTELMSVITKSKSKMFTLLDRIKIISTHKNSWFAGNPDDIYPEIKAKARKILMELYPDQNYDEVMSYLKENNLSALISGYLLDSGYQPQEITALAIIEYWFCMKNTDGAAKELYSWYHELIKRELFRLPNLKEGDC